MCSVQSQEVQNFLNNDVNLTSMQQVIQRHASDTQAVINGRQGLKVRIKAGTDVDNNNILVNQRIVSYIDVEQMISRDNKTDLVNDLQTTATNTLESAMDKYVDSLAGSFLSSSSNQQLVNSVRNSISTYVSQTINTSTIDNLLLSASSVQDGVLEIDGGGRVLGNQIVWNQDIQTEIMAKNIITDVMSNSLTNTQLQELGNAVRNKVVSKDTNPISDVVRAGANLLNPRSIILIAALVIGVIVAIIGIVLAITIGGTPKIMAMIGGAGVALGVIIAIGGIIYYAASKPKVA